MDYWKVSPGGFLAPVSVHEDDVMWLAEAYPDWIFFEARLTVEEEPEWKPGKWWRVLASDGSLWSETSDADEAFASMVGRTGDKIERSYVTSSQTKWVEVTDD